MDADSKLTGHRIPSGSDSQAHEREAGREHSADNLSTKDVNPAIKKIDDQLSNSNMEDNDDDDKEGDDEDDDDKEKVIEKSHNERFLKKNAQIIAYKVPGVNAYASFEIKTGREVLWNDVICESSETKEARLLAQLKKMRRSHHPNCMRILDCWRNEKSRISFITERPDETYTTLRHWFNISRLRRNSLTTKRLIRQVVAGLKYFVDHSLVHGNVSVDSIFIYGTNIKLGPFSLDAFWHTHTVRKTGAKKNYYLSNDWNDPAARITSLADAYAMGVVGLEMALCCSLDNELSAPDCDVIKYVTEKVEQLDDLLLRNFIKVCISGDRHHGVAELFDLSAFFEPPSLRHAAAKVITDGVVAHFSSQKEQSQQQSSQSGQTGQTSTGPSKQTADINGAYQELLRSARSSFEDDSIIVKATRCDGTTKQLLFKDVAQYYISFKFLEDVDHGYYPLIKYDSSGTAIVPPHVHRIINGDWKKASAQIETDAKEKDKAVAASASGSSTVGSGGGGTVAAGGGADGASAASAGPGDGKHRKDSRELGGYTSDAGGGRSGTADKISPPRGGSATPSSGAPTAASGAGVGMNAAAAVIASRPPASSPARQPPPSKLPVADSAGVRRSGSSTGISAGGGAKAGVGESGQAHAGTGGASGQSGGSAATSAATGAASSSGAGAAAGGGLARSQSTSTARDGRRSSQSRASHGSTASAVAGAVGGGGASGGTGTGGAHVIRRTGVKSSRGPPRASTGSAVTLRRRGSGSGPPPPRGRHTVMGEGASRSSRGGRSAHIRFYQDSGSGARTRRTNSEIGTREARRSSSGTSGDKRVDVEGSEEKKESNAQSNTQESSSVPTCEDNAVRISDSNADENQQSSVDDQAQYSLSEDEDGEDFDYYEDDLEEVCEEDEVEYEYQFQQRDRRRLEENEANIVIDVDQPAGEERGTAYFTDVFYEYLGLGRWLLVVKFHLLRSKEDPRGNLYREIMLQLNDSEWHDIDNLADRLTASGLIMRPEERSTLRQYLDAARHNRPLRETSVQDGSRGPDPQDLAKRLQEVQDKQRIEAAAMADREQVVTDDGSVCPSTSTALSTSQLPRDEKCVSVEPLSSLDFGEQPTELGETDLRIRSHLETPMSEVVVSVPDVSASRSRADSRLQYRDARITYGHQMLDSPRPMTGESLESGANGNLHPIYSDRELESEDDGGEDKQHYHHTHTHSSSVSQCQNPLEPLNKFCPFCDKCDYLLVDGPVYLRSPCYHCRVVSAEKDGLSGEQLYRLHTQHRVPWPLFLQKYFDWPPLERVTYEDSLADCQWRSRVVCVCTPSRGIWPPCVEFPWLYNPPKNSVAHQMQIEQLSRGLHFPPSSLQPVSLWCQHQTHTGSRTLDVTNKATNPSVNSEGRLSYPVAPLGRGQPFIPKRSDPELTARTTRRSRSLTVGANDQALWKQILRVSQTSSLAATKVMNPCFDSEESESSNVEAVSTKINCDEGALSNNADNVSDEFNENSTSKAVDIDLTKCLPVLTAGEMSSTSETTVVGSVNTKRGVPEQIDAHSIDKSNPHNGNK